MSDNEELNINGFIERFHGDAVRLFSEQGDYWFAMILFRRYLRNGARLVYDQEGRRFGTRIGRRVYDIHGDVTNQCNWVLWDKFDKEPARSEIIRTKMMFD